MNLLFLTYQGDIAGSTNSISYLTKGLAEKGHNIYVGCRKESYLHKVLQGTRVNLVPMTFKSKFDLNNIRHIRDVVKKHNIQLINAQSSKDRYTSIFSKWIYRLNVKIVHTRRQIPKSIGGLQNLFYVKGTDKILVISDELKNVFVNKGFPKSHIHVIYNGMPSSRKDEVDNVKVAQLREKFQIAEGDTVIGCVSRKKNQDQLIKALPYLNPDIKVIFVGVTQEDYKELIESLQIKNKIYFLGQIDTKEVLNYYPLFTLKVLPSSMDGFGMALVEAMMLGIPVIGTNVGGIKNVINDGVNGLLFEDNNIEDLVRQINTCLVPEVMHKLIENGKKRALDDFSIENMIEKYISFYSQLIQ